MLRLRLLAESLLSEELLCLTKGAEYLELHLECCGSLIFEAILKIYVMRILILILILWLCCCDVAPSMSV